MKWSVLSNTEQFVRSLLEKSLDKRLYYHNLLHTINVVEYASSLALTEGLSKEDTELVLIAEWFHDTGFTVTYSNHEEESMHIAANFLESKLPAEKIKVVTECILATKKGVIPADLKQYIMHDADYYHFFQSNYFQLVSNLKREVSEFLGKEISQSQWYEQNAKFLLKHSFYTTRCKDQWKKRKDVLLMENSRVLHRSDD